jgi:hypothetical protein
VVVFKDVNHAMAFYLAHGDFKPERRIRRWRP